MAESDDGAPNKPIDKSVKPLSVTVGRDFSKRNLTHEPEPLRPPKVSARSSYEPPIAGLQAALEKKVSRRQALGGFFPFPLRDILNRK